MNRWQLRLGELRSTDPGTIRTQAIAVQNVQSVQNAPTTPTFEHSEHFEQRLENASVAGPTPFAHFLAALQARQPQGVDGFRWREALKDGRRFLETWGSQAANLGWTANDLFGLHPIEPLARYDAKGLVWLLHGRPVVALTATEATIQASSGATLSFKRAVSR
jgi:hypothetical protein